MEEMIALLDQLESKLEGAKRLPRGVMPILEAMRSALQDRAEAEKQRALGRERVIAQAREEAERIVAQARRDAERLTAEQEVLQAAKLQAEEMRQQAAAQADGVRSGADEYAFEVLCQLEQELNRTLTVIANGLRTLQDKRGVAAPGPSSTSPEQENGATSEAPDA
jgi:hypothetical protein